MRKRIYIAGPMSHGDRIESLNAALHCYQRLLEYGFAPLCPQLTFFVDGLFRLPWQTWIDADLPWVSVADAVLRLPGESAGADAEVACAKEHGVPVYFSINDLLLANL